MGARNVIRLLDAGLKAGEKFEMQSGESLKFLPKVDDQGAFHVGDGTNDMDFKWFGGNTSTSVLFDVGNKALTLTSVSLNTAGTSQVKKKVTALTANTTLNATHIGGVITNRGAGGAITVTIPDSGSHSGSWFEYYGLANQNVNFVAATAGDLVGINDAAVNSAHFNTANQLIGASAKFFSDGTSWFVVNQSVGATLTLVT